METLVALTIGALTSAGVYLMLRMQTFPVILGLTFVSYAVNLFIFAAGRLVLDAAPIIGTGDRMTDPLPQALVLTAIVISFAMTAVIVILALAMYLESGDDEVDARPDAPQPDAQGDGPP